MKIFYLTLLAAFQISLTAAPKKIGHPSFLSPHARPILAHEGRVFVANTPSDSVDVIDAKTRKVIRRIPVGIDPVSLALRPDEIRFETRSFSLSRLEGFLCLSKAGLLYLHIGFGVGRLLPTLFKIHAKALALALDPLPLRLVRRP